MTRYFIEVSYLGTGYAGFQIQENAHTVQAEVERALEVLLKRPVTLTGSSRTDAGVHAEQNYFQVDIAGALKDGIAYNLNALLPPAVAVKSVRAVREGVHCRFDAQWRQYRYEVYDRKDPFRQGRGYYYPYRLDDGRLADAAALVCGVHDFASFSKRRSQARTTVCSVFESDWVREEGCRVYRVRANRFLRGMVRGLVATMLRVGRGLMTVEEFGELIGNAVMSSADFSVPGGGLFLERVEFEEGIFAESKKDAG